jgi:tRNA acetyltransferase TAN1
MNFNLLASTTRSGGKWACVELLKILNELGDAEAVAHETSVLGLVTANTKLNSFEAVHKMRGMLKETPWTFRSVLKVIPIEKVTNTDVVAISSAVSELAHKIGVNETFRVTIDKRHSIIHTKAIVEAVASRIMNEVSLENPDKIILIEVLGGITGISILKLDDILSIVKEKKLI